MNTMTTKFLLGACFTLFATTAFSQGNEKPEPGKQVEQTFQTSDGESVSYLLYLPSNFTKDANLPLVYFLHGRGESYGPLSLVAKWGPPKFAERGDKLNYILVSPQCPKDDSWSKDTQQTRLKELLDYVVKEYGADKKRLYLTGLSMGGYGSWRMAAAHPKLFAAVAPVCGGGDPKDADKLKDTPIWVFHGDRDGAVPFQKSVDMVEAIKAAGGKKVRFTTFEHFGHNCWSATYNTPELFGWMFKHKVE